MAFNIFLVPTLEFVGQLCVPSDAVTNAISSALRRLATGPGYWCTISDLEHLQSFGFPLEFRTLEKTARAAKIRVVENIIPDLAHFHRNLEDIQLDNLSRPLGAWHQNSFVAILQRNLIELQKMGITRSSVQRDAAECMQTAAPPFQQLARQAIARTMRDHDSMARIRHKFQRWKLGILPGHIGIRVLKTLNLVGARCRPCVLACLWRTMWNGWPTSARMKSLTGTGETCCALGCRGALDRIEHYAVCPAAWNYFANPKPAGLGLDRKFQNLAGFLCVEHGMPDADKARMAIAVYASARTVQQRRESPNSDVRVLLRLHAKLVWVQGC